MSEEQEPPEQEPEQAPRPVWVMIGRAIAFGLCMLAIFWIFPTKGKDDWWTLEPLEIYFAIGFFFFGLHLERRR